MKREIKFRAYVKNLKLLVPVEQIDFKFKTVEVDLSYGYGSTSEYDIDEVELMQFIGLRDKNDKEIYESDVVKVEDYVAVIKWNVETCRFVINAQGEHLVCDFDYYYGKELEIIGNIHDNPEFMEVVT